MNDIRARACTITLDGMILDFENLSIVICDCVMSNFDEDIND